MKNKLKVQDIIISVSKIKQEDFISLTDMARYKNPEPKTTINNWLKNKKTIEYVGLWEKVNNDNFNLSNFKSLKNQAGSKNFSLSISNWVTKTKAIGIISKAGRYGGTYAHKDIAFEFERWLKSIPNNKPDGLYIIKTGSYYKIGITQDIKSRIKNIETHNPFKPELIFYEKIPESHKIEKLLHLKYKHKNIKNEWFKLSSRDINSIIKEIVKLTNIDYLTDRQQKILKILQNKTSTINLSKEIGVSKTTILKELKILIKQNKIQKIRNGRNITYQLI
jgi:hypothetical protein